MIGYQLGCERFIRLIRSVTIKKFRWLFFLWYRGGTRYSTTLAGRLEFRTVYEFLPKSSFFIQNLKVFPLDLNGNFSSMFSFICFLFFFSKRSTNYKNTYDEYILMSPLRHHFTSDSLQCTKLNWAPHFIFKLK